MFCWFPLNSLLAFFPLYQFSLQDPFHLADLLLEVHRVPTLCDIIHAHGFKYYWNNHVFYFLHVDALTSGALLTLEGLPLPGLADSEM